MSESAVGFDSAELRNTYKAFKILGDEAKADSQRVSNGLAEYLNTKIRQAGYSRTKANAAIKKIVDGGKVSKTSTTGEIKYGFASQRLSGGANTKDIWAGLEFGSNKYKQFPSYSGRQGRGSRGWFIYPTLRNEQSYIVSEWTKSFNQILDKWGVNGI